MSDIKINIVGEFNKKGFVEADKATINLSNNFDKLRQSARRTFATILGYRALKESVKAFAANDAAIQNLTKSLDNLGFRFEAPGLVTYLENLEKATAVSKDDLFPAFRNLANATLDVQQSQQLLATALDISAATGAELGSVTSALTRAYNGNFSSLGKIQNAYTMAELKAMGFSESVRVLQEQFSGQAAAAADTYQAKITRLNLALGDAAEAIGEGVVDALEALGGGNYDRGLELIAAAGEKVGDAFRFAATGVAYFNKFWKQGLFATQDQLAQFRLDMDSLFRDDPAKIRAAARERSKGLAAERAQTEKIRKSREAAAKLAEKEKKNQLALNKAKSLLDLEKIQVEAALKGKITDEERARLMLMKAILNEEGAAAEKLSDKLQKLKDDTTELAGKLTAFPKANDPFKDWVFSLDAINAQLTAMGQKKVVIDFINNYTSTATNSAAASIAAAAPTSPAAAIAAATSPAAIAVQAAKEAEVAVAVAEAATAAAEAATATAEAITAQVAAAEVLAAAVLPEEIKAAEIFVKAADEAAAAALVQTEAAAALDYVAATLAADTALAEATQAEQVAEILAAESNFYDAAAALADASQLFDLSVLGAYSAGVPSVEINVTVEGNVTAEQDLAEKIYDTFLGYQKSGKGLIYQAVAI